MSATNKSNSPAKAEKAKPGPAEEKKIDPIERQLEKDLHKWPYATDTIYQNPDPELLKGHTNWLLSRAINTKRLVLFAGSGLSAAYGQPSWKSFVGEIVSLSKDREISFLKTKPSRTKRIAVRRAAATRDHLITAANDRPETLVPTLQICQYIYELTGGAADFRKAVAKVFAENPMDRDRSPQIHDPLQQLWRELGIVKFLTVNYDNAIENFLMRENVRIDQDGFLEQESPGNTGAFLTSTYRSQSLDESTLGDLIAFSVSERPDQTQVFHLHGHVDQKSTASRRLSSLIVTERDYQARYAQAHPRHSSLDCAMKIALTSNPMLLVGIGLNEDDILRPLRQALEDGAPLSDRLIVALMPQWDDNDAILHPHRYLNRYGIYSVYYGGSDLSRVYQELKALGKSSKVAIKTLNSADSLKNLLHNSILDDTEKRRILAIEKPNLLLRELIPRDELNRPFTIDASLDRALARNLQLGARELERLQMLATGLALRIKLNDAICQHRDWLARWQAPTPARVPALFNHTRADFQTGHEENITGPRQTIIVSRHAQRLASFPFDDRYPHRRFYSNLPSQTFERFFDDLAKPKLDRTPNLIVVNAPRGTGKGHFATALLNPDRIDRLARALGRDQYDRVAYFSLGTASQVGSVIDGLNSFLAGACGNANEDRSGISSSYESMSRLAQTRHLLESVKRGRHLLIIGSIHRLLQDGGFPKNSHLGRFLTCLLENDNRLIDIVVTGDFRLVSYASAMGRSSKSISETYFHVGEKDRRSRAVANSAIFELLRKQKHVFVQLQRANHFWLLRYFFPHLSALFKADVNSLSLDSFRREVRAEIENYRISQPTWMVHTGKPRSDVEGCSEFHDILTELWKLLEGNRYSFTLLAACCDIGAGDSKSEGTLIFEEKKIHKQRSCILSFLRKVKLELSGARPAARHQKLVSLVLEEYELRHRERKNSLDFSIQRCILWHLAAMDQPVELEVLAGCAGIRDAIRVRGKSVKAKVKPGDSIAILRAAVEDLVYRCLVIEFCPFKDGDMGCGTDETHGAPIAVSFGTRYSVHRSIQQFALSHLGGMYAEFTESDPLTVSIYATQPNDLPSLTSESYVQLRDLVSCLTGFPESDRAELFHEKDCRDRDLPELQSLKIRAALGVLRSVFSCAVLHRQAVYSRVETAGRNRRVGLIEEHRRQVFWLINRTFDLARSRDKERIAKEPGKTISSDLVQSDYCPLYREELVWVLNECGVLSYTQGRLHDSIGLLDRAMFHAEELERGEFGGLKARVGLNRVAVDIDRGRFKEALRHLDRISATPDETPVLHRLADCYRGLVFHLKGRLDEAFECYHRALHGLHSVRTAAKGSEAPKRYSDLGLLSLGRARAAAITTRHLADLYRLERRYDDSDRTLTEALHLAQEGKYEDIRHSILLARVRLTLARLGTLPSWQEHMRDAQAAMLEVEHYAREMGIPRLESEILELRAQFQLRGGDLQSARDFACRAIEIANLHGLLLRKMQCMNVLAKALYGLKEYDQARSIAMASLQMAEQVDYHCLYADAHSLVVKLEAHRQTSGEKEVHR